MYLTKEFTLSHLLESHLVGLSTGAFFTQPRPCSFINETLLDKLQFTGKCRTEVPGAASAHSLLGVCTSLFTCQAWPTHHTEELGECGGGAAWALGSAWQGNCRKSSLVQREQKCPPFSHFLF